MLIIMREKNIIYLQECLKYLHCFGQYSNLCAEYKCAYTSVLSCKVEWKVHPQSMLVKFGSFLQM